MSDLPLAGRRFYFVGIGGAGLAAYANIARAWGAEVAGWDVRDTIFLEAVADVEVDIGGEPAPPEGFEVVVSAAHAGRIEGRSRADFLAELVSLRPAIVIGGAHGKTTTTAMVAYALRELGNDPVVDRRRGRAAARRERGCGGGLARRRRRRVRSVRVRPSSRDRRRDEHRARSPCGVRVGSRARGASSTTGSRGAPQAVRGWELEPVALELARAG